MSCASQALSSGLLRDEASDACSRLDVPGFAQQAEGCPDGIDADPVESAMFCSPGSPSPGWSLPSSIASVMNWASCRYRGTTPLRGVKSTHLMLTGSDGTQWLLSSPLSLSGYL